MLSKRDLLVVMPTGSGKSLLYQLPAVMDNGLTIVVSPLISLMKDQVDELTRKDIPATFVNSSLSVAEQRERLSRCGRGEYHLLYIAPERFRNASFLTALQRLNVSRMAVDEAHCISEWGHDFRPDYRRLKDFREQMGRPRVSALTATATPRVQQDIITSLGLTPDEVDVHVHGFDRPNLELSVVQASSKRDKHRFLTEFVREHPGSGIIYVGTRRGAEEVAGALEQVEPNVTVYHAGMEPDERTAAQEAFLSGKARVVAATSAFGMGIDKRDVRFVVHYNYPGSVEQYYQEIGRAGRDGLTSGCVLLYAPSDRFLREFFIDLNYPNRGLVANVYRTLWRLRENPVMMTYKEIAGRCPGEMKDGQVGSAVRLLDGAGVTRAFAGETRLAVTLDRLAPQVLPTVRGSVTRRVLEGLSFAVDLEVPGRYEVDLRQLCAASGLSEDQVRRSLAAMDHDGIIRYEPPFRGRGIEKLVEPPPDFSTLAIDWERQKMLRQLEEEKLAAMEEYIKTSDCRRGFILHYFGETSSFRCGTCDRCTESGKDETKSALKRCPEVALPVLVCVRHLPFPLGKVLIARIVRGSADRKILDRRLDRNPAYGRVSAKRDFIKGIIDDLIYEGYLDLQGGARRPVVALTERGEEVSRDVKLDDLPAAGPTVPVEASKADVAELGTPQAGEQDLRLRVLDCIDGLRFAVGAGKIAEVLTGSKARWIELAGANETTAYRSVSNSREEIRRVIQRMLEEGLVDKGGSRGRPVLQLTEAGRQMLEGSERESRSTGPSTERKRAPEVERETPPPRPAAGIAEALDAMIGELLVADFEEAKAMRPTFNIFHPREVAERLISSFNRTEDTRKRSHVVWAVGELCGQHGLPFLIRCASSEVVNIRRLAASALGKVGEAMGAEPKTAADDMKRAQQALVELMKDDAVQVRQYAKKALNLFLPKGQDIT